ncbi:hypothetical protein [Demequina phytophila]|uniref:hypothetical protein n=1 Tax=Demequina phytophila TaxID=1638981 RepID=UPI0007823ECD|nr:hypothetical protein [Demequina phytophila]
MSNELMDSLARQAEAGGTLYDARGGVDDAVVAPARRRVRRAHTLRAAGTLGVTALVLAGGLTAVLEWQGDRGTVAPAVTDVPKVDPDALTADDLRPDSTARTLDDGRTGQTGILCSMPVKDNPYAGADFSRADSCPAVWVADLPLLEVTRADVTLDGDGTVHIAWVLANTSDSAITVDEGTLSIALLSDPDAAMTAEGYTSGDRQLIATSLWSSEEDRVVQMEGDSSRVTLRSGDTIEGAATLDPQMFSGLGTGGLLDGMSDGTIEPTVTLQVRVPPAGDAGTRELFLEASAVATTTGTMDPASASFEGLEPRVEGETRDDAQEAVVCHVGEADNPRFQPDDGDGVANWSTPTCEAVWIPGGKQLELSDVSISEIDKFSSVIDWSATNVSGRTLDLDNASMGVSINLGDVGYIMNSGGTSVGWNPWNSDGTRHALLSSESDPIALAPGAELSDEKMFETDPKTLDAPGSILIRVVREDDQDGTRELLLELPWSLKG